MEEIQYKKMVDYLCCRMTCDDTCLFHSECPVSTEGGLKGQCIVKRDCMFDCFYNLFFDTRKGIDEEIKSALFAMARDSVTSGDKREYLNNLVKVKTAFYGPDKDKAVDEITAINIDIVPVDNKKSKKRKK